ncbi:hypothetical protein AURANDRAFT_63788 [Aureococcus anophagefferens]|uniref:Uncharacterized protein n=1 Tax=Aureococcus anophagefferens TaxID=44056 RepID=F0Y7T0_AURAN|nr:hypothetical protein AURANDRAFT_63788 [Aureococcus anophagefferens]EGB08489.1 hypothetical protein AURANDRAFT_63788 [Aureococcus anophagefferens]|eukprot:XP_009036502.1 hypothetical protein AURANDRAFT_63788 [Aureococcus anophagefferens]
MGRAWAPVLGRPSEKSLAREPSRGLARGKSVVTFEVDQPALGDDGDGDEAPEAKRSLFCPRPGSSPRRRELDATSRNDLLNAFAKFSPAGVHAELTDLGGSESSFRAMSRKFMQKTFTEPSARSTRGALLFVDISGFTRLSTSLGIEALKRHINAIYTRAVDIIVKHGGDVLKFAGDAMLITWLAASDGDVALNGVVAAAANCALALQGPGSVHHVKEDGVDVHLSMHCALGAGKLTAYRLGDRDRWEFIVAGEPLEQIRVAEPCASAGQTSLSPEVWRRLARNGFSGAPSDLEPSVFLLHGRLRQSMTSLMFRGKSSSDVGAAPKRSGERSNSYRSPRGDAIAREIPDLIQLQHKARTSFRLRLRAHAEVLKCFTVPAVQEIYESLGSAGELQRERKDSSSRRAPEDHLAEQRQVTTVFINVVGLGDALMDGELDKVQDCFMTVQLCVRDRGGMLRQFIVDDKGVVAIAFFGVRGSSFEDNEYRAVRFTLAVVRALKRLDVDAYCGITVGKGFCGLVGAPNRCEYAVMGPTVNLAARLMAAASKKQSEPIFVDERVSRAARQSQSTRHVFTAMEPIKAKGFAEPVKVFALAESERDRGRVTASAAHEAQVPFTGREKLLASIDGIVEAAAREDESASPQPDSPGSPRSPLSPKRLLETMGQSTRKLVATTSSASAGALFPGRASSPSGSSRSLKASATPSPRTSPSLRLRSLSGPPKSDDPESVVRLVCVDGESGLGKSRLLREIAEKHGGAWDVVEASADAVTLQRPFAIWINVIRSLVYARHGGRSPRAADVVRALGRADARSGNAAEDASLRTRHSEDANPKPSPSRALSTKLRKASGALAGAGDDDKHSLSRFIRERMTKSQVAAYGDRLAFLDGDGMDSPEWTALNKSFKLEILAAAIAALVAAPSRRAATRRTLLLIDNGHWLDFPSWELLEELVTKKQSHVGPAQVVVVLTKRGGVKLSAPNVWDNLMATYTTTTLSLDPLGAAASCKLLCAALDIPGHSVTPGTVDNVLRKCAGIPVLILALVESIEKHVKQAEAGIEDTVLEGETLSSEMSEETLAVVKSALQKVPCFINLDDEAKFKHVASRMVRIDCAPGKTLITKGEKGSTIYVLESGAMECVVDGVKVSEVSAGDVIGERAMLTNSARTATVSAATDTVLWSLERRDARFLVKEADYVWRRVLALESLSIPTRGDSSFMMPSSMAGIITNRLDTLSLNATTVVKLASAFGPVFHEEALRTCFPGPKRSKSADAIAELVAAALIQPQDPPLGNETLLKPSLPNQRRSWAVDSASPKASDAPGEDEKERDECDSENGAASSSGLYRFKNQQIAEVIYSVVLDEQKREYHRRIAEFFEDCLALVEGTRTTHTRPETKPALLSVITALHLGRSDLHLLLADHYTRSKSNEDKAMAYSLVAAKGATTLGLYREAEQLYRRVASQKVARKTALSPKEIKITESARLQSYIELAELYARFEMEPRPREDAEASPLGESSIALLSHALAILGVDHEALGEDGFASLLASNDREEHLSQSEKKLLARALSQLGWCHVRAGTALDHQFALQLTESCFAHSIRLSKVAGDKLAAADALNGFGTFYQLCASQVGELHATLGDTIRPSPAPAGRRLARSASQGEIPPAVVAAAKADEPPSTPGAPASSLFKRLTHSAPRKGADHDDEPPPRAPGDGKKSANRYKRTNTDATPENLKPPTPPGEHRSLLRFSRLLLLSRPDLWSIAEDKLMESYDIRESSCVEGKPSLDVAQVCVTLGSLQMDMSKIDAARAYYALALHMYESELGPLHPRTAHALAGLARIARNQGTKLITDPTPTTRRAGALILDEAIDYQARAVKARSALGQRHGTYQASVAELRAMELQRDALHLTEPAPRSADSPYQPGRAQRRKSL